MNPNKTNFTYYKNNSEHYDLGCDGFSLSLTESLNFRGHLHGLNNVGSDYFHIEGDFFTYTGTVVKDGKNPLIFISISIDGISYSILRITRLSNNHTGCLGIIEVPGTMMRLIQLGYIPNDNILLKDVFGVDDYRIIQNSFFSRYDFRMDLFYSKAMKFPDPHKLIEHKATVNTFTAIPKQLRGLSSEQQLEFIKQRAEGKRAMSDNMIRSQFESDTKQITGFSIGTKQTKEMFIRVYDKLLDITDKAKRLLYNDYYNYEAVFRIEIMRKVDNLKRSDGSRFRYCDKEELDEDCYKRFQSDHIKEKKRYNYIGNDSFIQAIKPYLIQTQNRLLKLMDNDVNPITATLHAMRYKRKLSIEDIVVLAKKAIAELESGRLDDDTIYYSI